MAGRIAYLGNIVTQGLVLDLDAAIQGSYPKTGSLWTDISGNNNNGILTNGPAYTGSDYGAIVFDGVDDFVNISSSDTINFGTSNFTSNLWIYPFSASLVGNTEYGVINKNGGFQNSPGWGLELSTYLATAPYPKLYLEGFNSGQTSWGNSNVDGYINTQAWSNINLIRTGTRFDLYINGSPVSSKTNSNIGLNVNNTANLTLGKNGSWQSSFKGNISDFNLYNQALSQFQVWQNFNAYKSRYGIPDIVTDGLILNLDAGNPYSYLSGSSGTTWSNTVAVSSSISGTLVNGPVYSNGAITFDGVDDYVTGSLSSFNVGSFSMWINSSILVDSLSAFKALIVLRWTGTTNSEWYVALGSVTSLLSNEYVTLADVSAGTRTGLNDGGSLLANTWYNLTFNLESGTYKIYLNGVKKTEATAGGGVQQLTIPNVLQVGSLVRNGVIDGPFQGKIAITQLYNRALSQAEITQNFNALRGRYGI